jgi:putative tryptophan/tyrosine transport system substrate-binding protein
VNTEQAVAALQTAAARIGLQLEIFYANTNREIDIAFTGIAQKRADALMVIPFVFFLNARDQLAALAAHYRVPAMYANRLYAEAGGLMSYGASIAERERQLGIYTGRILKGEKPSDLPVMQPTKFELVINQKTAKALGLTIPETLLATADEVIQ